MKYIYLIICIILFSCKQPLGKNNNAEKHLNSTNKKLNELGVNLDFQFAIGNANKILQAVKSQDFNYLNKIETKNKLADFSLHLTLKDIEFLINCASKFKNNKNLNFHDNLDFKKPYVDNSEYGAVQTTAEFINLFASIDESNAEEIAENWFLEMKKSYPTEKIEITEDAKKGIRNLIQISKQAKLHKYDMVFIWTT